ncbi:GNAT family N-acetyltransferase [Georgenia halophila]|uniref:GNAT family N-acetyltransferase n=1 Tax=Georgenia halophila TaxID=620889 RepID=A0ABP8L5G2_9MICO
MTTAARPDTRPEKTGRGDGGSAVAVAPPPPGYRVAQLDDSDDRAAVRELREWGFVFESAPEDVDHEIWTLEPGRSVGVWDERGSGRPRLAAVHSSHQFRMPVPGGTRLPTAGLASVVVHPSHRRRGLARTMITTHLARSLDRGEVLSALHAAETGIYGRYGYGVATQPVTLRLGRRAELRGVDGVDGTGRTEGADVFVALETLDPSRHVAEIERVHTAVERPGWIARDTEALRTANVADPPSARRGHERMRIAVVRTHDGEPRGYATFRRQGSWSETGVPEGVVRVREAVTLDAAAARALWTTLTDIDLMASVETGDLAADDPLVHLLTDLRRTNLRVHDGLWLRLLDVPAALAAREYSGPVDVVLEVSDELVPANAGRWHLRSDGMAEVEVTRTEEAGHLALDVAELASVYLGTTSLAALAGAGRVRELVPGRLATAATAFGWPIAPANSWGF